MRARRWLAAFACLASLGATWALATPVLANADEPAHSVKAAATVRGQLVPPKEAVPDEGPGSILRGGFTTVVTVPGSYGAQTSYSPDCYIYDRTVPAGCAAPFVDDPEPTRWTTLIGRYPPTYYALVGWPTLVDTSVHGFYAMRVVSIAINAALLATALVCVAGRRRFAFMALGILVASTPQVLMLGAAINPNGIEISAALCAWATGVVVLADDGDSAPRGPLAAFVVAGVLLAWTRPLSTLWLAVVGITLLTAFGDRERLVRLLRGTAERLALAALLVAGAVGGLWTLLSDNLDNNSGYDPRGLGFVDAVEHSLRLTPSYLHQMVAVFGWFVRVPAPVWLSWAWGAALLLLLVVALRSTDTRRQVAVLALLVVAVLLPTALQAPTAERIGFVWSGRYGLAVGVGVPILAAAATGLRRPPGRHTREVAAVIAVLVVVVHVAAHWANMRRYVVGTDGPWWYFGHDGWTPPLPSVLLLAAVVVSAGAFAALCWRWSTTGWPAERSGVAPPAASGPVPATVGT